MGRIKGWTKLNAEGLWLAWRDLFASEDAAIARAVFCANRLVKFSKSRDTRHLFYDEIKDPFIRRYGRDGVGQRVRHEVAECFGCYGDGCERCGWTGNHRERWLYVHRFTIAGKPYCFHSYVEPATLVSGLAADDESFGTQLTDEELAELPLPLSGLIRMLRYVAAVVWAKSKEDEQGQKSMDIRYFWVGEVAKEQKHDQQDW